MTAEKRDPLLCTPGGVRPTDCTDSTTAEPDGTPITAELAPKGDLRRPKAQPELSAYVGARALSAGKSGSPP
jgi:hypothetical protein